MEYKLKRDTSYQSAGFCSVYIQVFILPVLCRWLNRLLKAKFIFTMHQVVGSFPTIFCIISVTGNQENKSHITCMHGPLRWEQFFTILITEADRLIWYYYSAERRVIKKLDNVLLLSSYTCDGNYSERYLEWVCIARSTKTVIQDNLH